MIRFRMIILMHEHARTQQVVTGLQAAHMHSCGPAAEKQADPTPRLRLRMHRPGQQYGPCVANIRRVIGNTRTTPATRTHPCFGAMQPNQTMHNDWEHQAHHTGKEHHVSLVLSTRVGPNLACLARQVSNRPPGVANSIGPSGILFFLFFFSSCLIKKEYYYAHAL